MSLYVVLLEKKASLHKTCFQEQVLPSSIKHDAWISMGHFDATYTYTPSEKHGNVFKTIRDNNQLVARCNNGDHYLHPLYLLTDRDDQDFWNDQESKFLAISRIHFSSNTDVNKIFVSLENDLRAETHKHSFSFRLYHTIELSDALVAIKGNNLYEIMDFSMSLRMHSCIGRVYTHCSINRSILSDNDWQKWHLDESDSIPLCTIRFAAKSFSSITHELEKIRSVNQNAEVFTVTGVDDIIVRWENLPSYHLAQLFRKWFCDDGTLNQSFSSLTTRLGTVFDEEKEWKPTDSTDSLNQICANLTGLRNEVQKSTHDVKRAWVSTLLELTASLVRISRTSMLDEFVYLMYPGAYAFLNRVSCDSQSLSDNTCDLFVESWENILERIMRTEGQLTQYPELRPMVYDIPIALLEYILSFLNKTATILQKNDTNKRKISFFLTPRLCKQIKSQELFQPDKENPGLVLVTLPFSMLYDLNQVQTALCHEVSHFVGEECRNREYRNRKYAQAVATLIARAFFDTTHFAVIHVLFEMLEEQLRDQSTMQSMEDIVINWAGHLCRDKTIRQDILIRTLNRDDCMSEELPYIPDLFTDIYAFSDFKEDLSDLSTLFRECYADLCMLNLLPVQPDSYIQNLVDDLQSQPKGQKLHYEQVAIRIYVVMKASGKFYQNETVYEIAEKDRDLGKQLELIDEAIRLKKNIQDRRIPIGSVYALLLYSKCCWEKLNNTIYKADRDVLKSMFNNFSSDHIDYEQFLACIDEYRISQLNDAKEIQQKMLSCPTC